jgi:hypothetical protein
MERAIAVLVFDLVFSFYAALSTASLERKCQIIEAEAMNFRHYDKVRLNDSSRGRNSEIHLYCK